MRVMSSRASLDDPIKLGDAVVAPKGADAKVRLVTETESGKLTGRTELTVQLLSFTVDGNTVPVNTTSVTEESSSRGARTAKSAAAVGAIGAIIGAIAGGGKGAAIGAGAGAAAGAGAQVFMKGQRVRIPSETVLTFTTQETVKLPYPASHHGRPCRLELVRQFCPASRRSRRNVNCTSRSKLTLAFPATTLRML